jgi:hypothetical protein
MRKILMFFGILLYSPLIAAEKDYPKAEIFTGYSWLNGSVDRNFGGADVSIAGNFNKWFGVVADFSGHYRGGERVHSFLFGPKFTSRGKGRVNPYFQTLFGAALLSSGVGSDTHFCWAAGGGVDVKVHKNVAIRVIDMTYLLIRENSVNLSNGRLSSGLVWRFGGK